ncbi:MAG: phosphodiester glycosidase family protein [Synergistaceae bacterium]|jgi:hypothetical protein|nr:phosphodiester glycosidase family protein [Synergistaceae bacterium]
MRREDFLSKLLAARGFETTNSAPDNAALILKSGIVTDSVAKTDAPVTRRDAVRWMIQSLGLSMEARILSRLDPALTDLPFRDAKSLPDYERGCLAVAYMMKPQLVRSRAEFGASHKMQPDEAMALLEAVREAGTAMSLDLRISPARGLNLSIHREGTFSGVPKWRVYVDGFDGREQAEAARKALAKRGFSTEVSSPNYEWRLTGPVMEDYGDVRRLAAIAEGMGKTARIFPTVINSNSQPLYWVMLVIDPSRRSLVPVMPHGDPADGMSLLAPLSSLIKKNHAAINAGFFAVTGRNKGFPIGTLYADGKLLSRPSNGRSCIGWRSGKAGTTVRAAFGVAKWNAESGIFDDGVWDDMEYVMQGGPLLIRNGEVVLTSEGFKAQMTDLRHPRSVVGLTRDGRWFFFVGDGRDSTHSVGFTLREAADLLLELGASYALNLDGGGSSEMIVNGVMLNSPSEKRERPISYGIAAEPR